MNNNARCDKSTKFLELEVSVPRTIGILRDVIQFYLHLYIFGDSYSYFSKHCKGQQRKDNEDFKRRCSP